MQEEGVKPNPGRVWWVLGSIGWLALGVAVAYVLWIWLEPRQGFFSVVFCALLAFLFWRAVQVVLIILGTAFLMVMRR